MTSDRGSLSIEYVILTPVVFLVFGLIFVFARVSSAESSLDAGTRDAARAVSLSNGTDTHDIAENAIKADLGTGTSTCSQTLNVDVLGDFAAGNTITVQAKCTYQTSDVLYLPGALAPGGITVHSQFSAVIDLNRSLG